jgi:hypothetical protein
MHDHVHTDMRWRLAAERFVRQGNLNTGMALATSGTGAPLPCPMLDLFVASRLAGGAAMPSLDGSAQTGRNGDADNCS